MRGKLDALCDYIASHAKLDPALLTGASFAALVAARIDHHGLSGPVDYLDLLRQSADEVELLVGEIAVPETWLFRYPQSYELLADWLASRCHDRQSGGRLRMLSVGCATGEEPCSMAITAVHAGWAPGQIDIEALDRSGRWTAMAKRGQFGLRSLRPDMPAWARRHLQIVDRQVDVDPVVAGRIVYLKGDVFHRLDAARSDAGAVIPSRDDVVAAERPGIVTSGAAASYDVIFCRNLLIYLTRQAGEQLLRRLANWLAEDGLLFVGHAELWLAPAELFVPLATPHAFALRRAGRADAIAAEGPEGLPGTVATGLRLATVPSASDVHPGSAARCPRGPVLERPKEPAAVPGPVASTTSGAATVVPTLAMTRQLADRGELEQALTAAESILAREGPAVELLELLGSLQLALNRLEAARDSFGKVIYLDPNHTEALLQLAMLSQRLGDDGQATRYRRRAERAHRGDDTR